MYFLRQQVIVSLIRREVQEEVEDSIFRSDNGDLFFWGGGNRRTACGNAQWASASGYGFCRAFRRRETEIWNEKRHFHESITSGFWNVRPSYSLRLKIVFPKLRSYRLGLRPSAKTPIEFVRFLYASPESVYYCTSPVSSIACPYKFDALKFETREAGKHTNHNKATAVSFREKKKGVKNPPPYR